MLLPPMLLLKLLLLATLAQAYDWVPRNDAESKGDTSGRIEMNDSSAWDTRELIIATSLARIATPPSNGNIRKGNRQTRASSSSGTSTSTYQVILADFVVSMSNSTYAVGVTTYLNQLLEFKLKKEFDSLLQVAVQLNSISSRSGQAFADELFYSGNATFSGVVSDANVRDEQTRVVLDLGNFNVSSPNVVAVRMGSRTNTPAGGGVEQPTPDVEQPTPDTPVPSPAQQQQQQVPTSDSPSMVGIMVGMIVAAAIGIGLAMYLGYNFHKSRPQNGGSSSGEGMKGVESRVTDPESLSPDEQPTPDDSRSVMSYGMNTETDGISFSGVSTLNSEAGFENNHHAASKSTVADDSSIEGSSVADSEIGLDATQLYLAKRLKEKERQYQLSLLAPKDPLCLYEFEADFAHDFQFQKFMESDDEDLYLTDNDGSVAGSEDPSECKASEKGLWILRWKQHKARMAASAAAS